MEAVAPNSTLPKWAGGIGARDNFERDSSLVLAKRKIACLHLTHAIDKRGRYLGHVTANLLNILAPESRYERVRYTCLFNSFDLAANIVH